MNKEKIIEELHRQYPNKNIVPLPNENPSEIICEVEPTEDHPERSTAIAVIDRSEPHKHNHSVEIYEVVKGELELYVGEEKYKLIVGGSHEIRPGIVHWAKGDSTWIKVVSKPGWTKEDHIFVSS